MKTFFTVEKIKILITIIEEGSFIIAAKRLNIPESNLRLQLEILEKQANFQILFEENNKIMLTEYGELLYRYGIKIFALYNELFGILKEIKNFKLNEIFIGGDSISGSYFLPKLITILKKKYVNINIRLTSDSNKRILDHIKAGTLNFAIIRGNINIDFLVPSLNSLEIYPFAMDFLVLAASKFQPFSFYNLMLLKHQLYDLNWVMFPKNSESRLLVDEILRKNNIFPERFNVVLELKSLEAIKVAVESGIGVAFIPLLAVQKELQFKILKFFTIKNFKSEVPIYLVLNPKNYNSQPFYFFLKEVNKLISD